MVDIEITPFHVLFAFIFLLAGVIVYVHMTEFIPIHITCIDPDLDDDFRKDYSGLTKRIDNIRGKQIFYKYYIIDDGNSISLSYFETAFIGSDTCYAW